VCATHLPLVVGFTAPRELAKWLRAILTARSADPDAFEAWPCPLCEIERVARASGTPVRTGGFGCPVHGGSADNRPLLDALERIAGGEKDDEAHERRVLRAALVLYFSLRGTSAFLPRID
jgi:hypothetical protein